MSAGKAPASSILGLVSASVEESVEGATKVLPVGIVRGLYCQYRALTDDEADAIRKDARARAKLKAKTGQGDDDPEGERQAAARVLASACVQLMVPGEDGYEPMHEALAEQGVTCPPLRYNRDFVEALAEVGDPPGGLTRESTMTEIVTTLHRNGESTAPLTSFYSIYEAWRAGVTASILEEALG